ncbi:hypothetical protein [Nocardia iowensis]|uniref:Transmembrane protein n=1 Tax=Nocardia iowensis TaxID=204891 RepID=A0ABX8RJ00_NOCIO|nr:hypothetical protein [Nocardia iowensis]QXN89579.1 hypothetical protein KV110_29375 [Nocardia iowensis]
MNDTKPRFLHGTPLGPVRRLVLIEATAGIAFAAIALPMSGSEVGLPDWIQLLGLGLLLTMLGMTLHTWRVVIGLRAWPGPKALRHQIRCERRLRRGVVIYLALAVVLTPVPPTWTGFWFATTVLTAAAAALALAISAAVAVYETRRGPA